MKEAYLYKKLSDKKVKCRNCAHYCLIEDGKRGICGVRENIKGKAEANKSHYEVGKTVRKTIEELGGTMPEELSTPKKSIKAIEKELADNKKLE